MKDLDTMTVSKVGQGTLPRWWREASGLSKGGLVEVRPMRDGKNSIVLTPNRPTAAEPLDCLNCSRSVRLPFPRQSGIPSHSNELPGRYGPVVAA